MEQNKCDECGLTFTSRGYFDVDEADVIEQVGPYGQGWQVFCPNCDSVVSEYGM